MSSSTFWNAEWDPVSKLKTNQTQRGSGKESSKVREDALSLKLFTSLCAFHQTHRSRRPTWGITSWNCLMFFYLIYNHYSFLLLYMLGCLCFLPYTRVWKTFTFWIRLTSPLFQCLEAISILPFDLELDHTFCDGANTKYLLQPHVLKSLLPTSGIISGGYGSFRWWVYLVDNSLGDVYLKNYFLSCYLSFGPLWYQ